MDMNATRERYHALKAELKRQMTASGKWVMVPALLDELNALRRQVEAMKHPDGAVALNCASAV